MEGGGQAAWGLCATRPYSVARLVFKGIWETMSAIWR
jgi:hypothetical protein